MTMDKPAQARRPGIASFTADDDIPIPTAEQRAAARTQGEGLGFLSEKPAPNAEKPRSGSANGKVLIYNTNFHIRVRPEDRTRFDDFAHRLRVPKGAAMQRLLDLAEAQEAALNAQGGK